MTASIGIAALRIAGSIVLDTTALVVWDIGTRSPLRLVADVRRSIEQRSGLRGGCARLTIGAFALVAGSLMSAPLATHATDWSIIECWSVVTALILEQLIGPDLRLYALRYAMRRDSTT